jgi:ectoine hydroxylase-related dioxygenase (phytanoyl-CoA dioxygenase family)
LSAPAVRSLRLHPWSRDFRWSAAPGPLRRVTPEQARQYDEQGFFRLERALPPEVVARVVAEIDPFEAQTQAFLERLDGRRLFIARADEITFTTHLVRRSRYLRELVASELFRDLVHDLIGPDVRLYWDQAVYKRPGTESPFPWHQDNGYNFVEPQQYLTCWIALGDTSEANGCPWVVPGLHRLGTLAHEPSPLGFVCLRDPPDAVPVPARAGDIVVFSSLTPHCTGPNRSDAVRRSYIVQYAPDGAEILGRDAGGAETRVRAADPDRQFPVLVAGGPPPREGASGG